MKLAAIMGIACAIVLHAAVLLFGGVLLPDPEESQGTTQEVELLSEVESEEEQEKPIERATDESEDMATEAEQPPDAAEIVRNLELSAIDTTPALEAASLGAIEAALNGRGGGGDFADALSFSSGGRIGGTGKAGILDAELEGAFSLAEIDQKPREVLKTTPLYPASVRDKKLECVVSVIFVVDASGKVVEPKVEKSDHPAFDKPALDAVKQWKFEPAIKAGQRVACRMRVPIRFLPR